MPTSDELHELLLRLTTDLHDRGAALGAVSLLDGALKQAIAEKLRPEIKADMDYLFHSGAPLGSLSAKIRVGYALSLFDKTAADDLECIREIRNAFAHTMSDLKFRTEEVAMVCRRIKILDRVEKTEDGMEWDPTARSRYLCSVSFYTFALHDLARGLNNTWTVLLSPPAA